MKWHDYKLDEDTSKTTEDVTLWKNERGFLKIPKGTILTKVLLDDEPRGFVLSGKSHLVIDAIAETERGAIGKPVEKTIDEPFLMLGEWKESKEHLTEASEEDFTELGYENQQQYREKAEDLLDTFFRHSHGDRNSKNFNNSSGIIFAFPNNRDKLDILLAKGSKLVYTADDRVFVSKGEKTVLTHNGNVVVSKPGKSVYVRKGCCPSIDIWSEND
ncbi:MAG: hypothetical protein JSV35_00855 [Candidatus Bathyarchaeota archaeon]|nr:MAG: hypothetical protein JSV35_00855 [Candidatus Bathyarchaeota archaeon]